MFLSTPSDLVRFGMAIESGKLLQPATVQTLQTSQRLASGEETGYGEREITIAVVSNISYADTSSLASRVAQAFAEPGVAQVFGLRNTVADRRLIVARRRPTPPILKKPKENDSQKRH